MVTDNFVHFHNHSDNSLIDGAMTTRRMVEVVSALGQPAVAMTDHGNLAGAYDFYHECLAVGIKPIIGQEFYVAPALKEQKQAIYWGSKEDQMARRDVGNGGAYTHLSVLARNSEGLRNLYRLHHLSNKEGFYKKPRIDLPTLFGHSTGLVVLSGCLGGELQTRLKLGQLSLAEEYIKKMYNHFGPDFYIEIMTHGIDIEEDINEQLIDLSRTHNIDLVATNDCHYAEVADRPTHDAFLRIQTGPTGLVFDGDGYHLKSRREMEDLSLPTEALDNSVVLADKIEDYNDVFEKTVRLAKAKSPDTLRALCHDWLVKRHLLDTYDTRMEYELGVIEALEFEEYFLVLWEIFAAWHRAGIRIGAGRGSGAGSLVCYALGLTRLDPIKHGLVFERFLNPKRVGFPDIDTDLPQSRRQEALEIVREMFGDDYVAIIGTRGEIKAKKALQGAGKVLGSYVGANEARKLLPPAVFGNEAPLSSIDRDQLSDTARTTYDLALSFEGLTQTFSQHPAGIIISPDKLSDIVPIRFLPDSQLKKGGWSGQIAMFEDKALEKLGLVKNDFLGIRNLDVVERVCGDKGIDWDSLPIDPEDFTDPKTFELFQQGHTLGVFQCDGNGMQRLLRDLRPTTFGDIAAVLALFRPGPMGNNSHILFAKRKNNKADLSPLHPELVFPEILDKTYGLVVFQEQVMEILRVMCGWDYTDAERVFYAMKKKDHAALAAARPDYEAAALQKGYSQEAIDTLWDALIPFADYSFNLAHSACYAVLSYWTAYLKANYPFEFMAALLGSVSTDPDKLQSYLDESARLGIPILGPDINDSDSGFVSTPQGLRYGLASIRGVAAETTAALLKKRPYKSVPDFFRRADPKILNSGTLTALAKAGAFDSLFFDRISLVNDIVRLTERAQAARLSKGDGLFVETYNVVHHSDREDYRREWEQETLGVYVTKPQIFLTATRPLDNDGWRFLRQQLTRGAGTEYSLRYKTHHIHRGVATLSSEARDVFQQLGVEVR